VRIPRFAALRLCETFLNILDYNVFANDIKIVLKSRSITDIYFKLPNLPYTYPLAPPTTCDE
jgi:hypothetical protein